MSAGRITALRAERKPRSSPDEDRRRIEAILKREAAGLLAYFERRVRPTEDAADLLSETLVVAWRRADVVPTDERQARMWLYGVARKSLCSYRRGQIRRDALSDQLRSELSLKEGFVGPAGGVEEDPRIDRLRTLIRRLPDQDREIFALHVWESFTLVEVAQMLDLPAGTIRSRYSRARAVLRAQIEAED